MFRRPSHDPCPFCDYLSGATPCAFIVPTVSAVMNRAQYEKGAVLLVPNNHLQSIVGLDRELMADLGALAERFAETAIRAFGAVGAERVPEQRRTGRPADSALPRASGAALSAQGIPYLPGGTLPAHVARATARACRNPAQSLGRHQGPGRLVSRTGLGNQELDPRLLGSGARR